MDITDTLKRAIAAAKAGRKAEARRLLEMVLDADERNERAWLWLSDVVETDEERIVCLENVLTINPENEMARKGLALLRAAPAVDSSSSPYAAQGEMRAATPVAEPLEPSAAGLESPAADSPAGAPPVTDNRAFIVITIVLALMLICTVLSVLAYVLLSPLG